MNYKNIRPQLSRLEIILFVAFMLRLIWAIMVPINPISDSMEYHKFAVNILSGRGYAFDGGGLTAFWPVGTSFAYAILYKLLGLSFLPIVCFNIIIGVTIVWLTYVIALRGLGPKVAVLAAWMVAIWPILIQYTTILASELLFIVLVLAALYVWGSRRILPVPRAVLWGALVCAATLVRPTALPLLLILPVLQWLADRDLHAALHSMIMATLAASILFSPWVYRNYQVFGGFVLVATNSGANLWMGNNPESTGGYMPMLEKHFDNEIKMDNYYKKLAVDYIKANPRAYLKLTLQRAMITYKSETIGVHWNSVTLERNYGKSVLFPLKVFSTSYWLLVAGLGLIGSYFLFRRSDWVATGQLLVIPAYFFMIPILTVGQDRYHVPLNPFIAIAAAYGIYCLSELMQRHRSS